jgi:hypothetical protein
MSTLAVVEEILRETQVPMSVRQIVEYAGSRLPSRSKTPDTVVARDLSMDIKRKGETSVFLRTAPGRYAIRELHIDMGSLDGTLAEASGNGHAQSSGAKSDESSGANSGAMSEQPHAHVAEQREAAAAPVSASAPAPADEAPPTSVLASAMKAERSPTLPAKKPPAADEQTGSVH